MKFYSLEIIIKLIICDVYASQHKDVQCATKLVKPNNTDEHRYTTYSMCYDDESWAWNVCSGKEMGVTDFIDSKACDKPVHEVAIIY